MAKSMSKVVYVRIVKKDGAEEPKIRMRVNHSGVLSEGQVKTLNQKLRSLDAKIDDLIISDPDGNWYQIGRAFADGSIFCLIQTMGGFPQLV